MKSYAATAFSSFLVLGLGAADARALIAVETVSGSATIAVQMPGTPIGPQTEFVAVTIPTSLDFTPGSVTFEGQPVDFDGTEADFLAASYSGVALFPVNAGPATVPVTGIGSISSISGALTATGTATIPTLDLGPAFQLNQLDLPFPQNRSVQGNLLSWSSAVIPELNGASIDLDMEITIFNVDPISGLVDLVFFGTLFAPSPPSAVPSLPIWGLVLLAAGLLGLALFLVSQRRSA